MISYDEMAIRRLHDEVVASFNSLNLEKLLSLHADNIILMEPGMPLISGKQEMKKLFNRFRREHIVLKLSFNIREVEVFGKRAFVRGQVMKATIQNNNEPVEDIGKFISLLQKQNDGSWLRTHVIVNSDMAVKVKPVSNEK